MKTYTLSEDQIARMVGKVLNFVELKGQEVTQDLLEDLAPQSNNVPKWYDCEIPEPQVPSILYIETINKHDELGYLMFHSCQIGSNSVFEFPTWQHMLTDTLLATVNKVLEAEGLERKCTGRWCVVPTVQPEGVNDAAYFDAWHYRFRVPYDNETSND
jgi:hypothetical protein